MKLAGTYLTFNGNCREAMTFYSKVFGTKIDVAMTWANPQGCGDGVLPKEIEEFKLAAADEDKDRMMHMSFMMDNGVSIMGCDTHPMMHKTPFSNGNNYQVVLEPDSEEEADRLYDALNEDGTESSPLQEMWWGSYHGSCTDKFGIRWMFDMATYSSEDAKLKQNLMCAAEALRVSAKIAQSTAVKLHAIADAPPTKKAKHLDEKEMETESA